MEYGGKEMNIRGRLTQVVILAAIGRLSDESVYAAGPHDGLDARGENAADPDSGPAVQYSLYGALFKADNAIWRGGDHATTDAIDLADKEAVKVGYSNSGRLTALLAASERASWSQAMDILRAALAEADRVVSVEYTTA